MEKNKIKKVLYKEKPIAFRVVDDGYSAHYAAHTSLGQVTFDVPFDDMGEKKFDLNLPAQLLIRWLKA